MLHITYDDMGVKITDTLQAVDGCERSKVKSCAVIKKTYNRA